MVSGEHASEEEGHFRVVGRLASEGVEGSAILELADAVRILLCNAFCGSELYLASESVTGKLPGEASLRAKNHLGLPIANHASKLSGSRTVKWQGVNFEVRGQ